MNSGVDPTKTKRKGVFNDIIDKVEFTAKTLPQMKWATSFSERTAVMKAKRSQKLLKKQDSSIL